MEFIERERLKPVKTKGPINRSPGWEDIDRELDERLAFINKAYGIENTKSEKTK